MTHYVALDVSLRSVAICIVDDNGDITLEKSVNAEVEDIVQILRSFDGEIASVGLEAGVLTQYLTYGLQAPGYELICMESRQVNTTLVTYDGAVQQVQGQRESSRKRTAPATNSHSHNFAKFITQRQDLNRLDVFRIGSG